MPSKKSTTVVFTPDAQRIKDQYTGAFSLRGMVSAGLVWFDSLLVDDKIKLLSAAKANKSLKPLIVKITGGERDLTGAVRSAPLPDGMARVSLDVPVDMEDPLRAFVETLVLQKSKVPQPVELPKRRMRPKSR